MLIHSTRFGELEVQESQLITFAHGLPGFPDETAFVLLPYDTDSPFAFLQSAGEPNLTFLVVEPFAIFPDYEFKLEDAIVQELGLSPDNLPQVFNIITIPEKTEEMTANLLAPIVINRASRNAAQVVLEKLPYTTRHRLFPAGRAQQEAAATDQQGGK